jgi:hypothetical protein
MSLSDTGAEDDGPMTFAYANAVYTALEKAPCVGDLYVLSDDMKLTPYTRAQAMQDLKAEMLAMITETLKEHPEEFVQYQTASGAT